MIHLTEELKLVFLILHGLAASIGVSGVFVLDLLFFKFLKDFRISHKEQNTLNTISKVFWFVLVVLIISGGILFLSDYQKYIQSSKFIAKMVVVFVIFLNGLFLNIFIGPNLQKVSFHLPHQHKEHELHRYSKLAFISGSISFVSWLTTFILGSLKSVNLSVWEILIIYAIFLSMAVITSTIIEKIFELRYLKKRS